MRQLPNGYLTLDKPRRRPARVEGHEVEVGHVNLIDRAWQYVYGDKSDGPQLALVLWFVLPAILALIIRNL